MDISLVMRRPTPWRSLYNIQTISASSHHHSTENIRCARKTLKTGWRSAWVSRDLQILKAVDAGELANAWNMILLPDKQSFAT